MAKWYVDLGGVSEEFPIIGAVVHDEGDVFDRALKHMKGSEYFFACPAISSRFSVRILRNDHHGRQSVLLIGTEMGGTGSSIVVHELAAQLHGRARRVLKVGTCVSTWGDDMVGGVLMPRWAIADDDVAQWDRRWSRAASGGLGPTADEVFRGKPVVRPDDHLWKAWSSVLSWEPAEPVAVWSTNAHYPIVWCSEFLGGLAQKYVMDLSEDSSTVGKITPVDLANAESKIPNTRPQVMGWDMECAALFSAGAASGIPVAAALVISYTGAQYMEKVRTGRNPRSEADGRSVHLLEDDLIKCAVQFLLGT